MRQLEKAYMASWYILLVDLFLAVDILLISSIESLPDTPPEAMLVIWGLFYIAEIIQWISIAGQPILMAYKNIRKKDNTFIHE